MHNLAWLNSTIANASFRLRRRVAGDTPFRSALEDDTPYELFVARAACMLGVALGEEADMFACGDQSRIKANVFVGQVFVMLTPPIGG